jgi:hypothetical protein
MRGREGKCGIGRRYIKERHELLKGREREKHTLK